ncbi:NUDIX hydrolase [Thermomonospora cellulosilytica]|uniref:8-oxo-dGTP pyrophosphatase MutT (NUDIX family) n=1 Tax=Thermomonospora cellulosilytica TaxID=1411118 RepID=A0A7W3R7C2_9ACTN|nr:NUDIX hydrolase [Thermomonospora cellulosilytica]MBA9002175.1 8-oxo-dGTP pyrophosphatase MutT (NUDIX family) [Thermomonospora cellulosilytica]
MERVRRGDGGEDLVIRLDDVQAALVGADGVAMAGELWRVLAALAAIRIGAWDGSPDVARALESREETAGDLAARQADTVYQIEQGLMPRLEAIRALALRALRAGGASYAELAAAMGVSRSTAQSRWARIASTEHPAEEWARSGSPFPQAPAPGGPVCDHRSVGIDIVRGDGARLMLERVRPPFGIAPAAGHVDDHGTPEDAARAETGEELGLTVVSLRPLTGGWLPNRCRRRVAPGRRTGHDWSIYAATVTGDLAPGTDEARNVGWRTPAEIQRLAERTVAHARGRISAIDFNDDPGLEPVWVHWYARLGVIDVTEADLEAVTRLFTG